MDQTNFVLDKKSLDFLCSIKIASIKRTEGELVVLNPDNTIETALKKLSTHAISSAPVFDPNFQKIFGSVDVLDLAVWVVRTFALVKGDKSDYDKSKLEEQFQVPIHDLLDYGISQFWPVSEEQSIASLISNYFKWRVHQVPVLSNKKISGYVSQFDVAAYLASNLNSLGIITKRTLKELGLDFGPVLAIPKGKPLIDAFSHIVETKFLGLAVIDEKGKLVNNISASDVKGLTKETFWNLNLPIEKVLNLQNKLPPVTCNADTTLGQVLQKLVDYKIHRIFVVDKENQPTNVITLTTIMKLFSLNSSECFA
jgi:predicted transcriptional regulator